MDDIIATGRHDAAVNSAKLHDHLFDQGVDFSQSLFVLQTSNKNHQHVYSNLVMSRDCYPNIITGYCEVAHSSEGQGEVSDAKMEW